MSLINYRTKEANCKLVYYGPSFGGKTTNIQWVYEKGRGRASQLMVLPSDVERTLFFDFLPLGLGKVGDLSVRLHLYSVPGQVVYENSRRQVLKALDAVVFVADSQKERMEENLQSFKDLEQNLVLVGAVGVPIVLQYNKRDLPNAASLKELQGLLNPQKKYKEFEACARVGKGVMECLNFLSSKLVRKLRKQQSSRHPGKVAQHLDSRR